MKTPRVSGLFFLLLVLILNGALVAQEITVFEAGRYGGKSQTFRSSIPNLNTDNWNDQISSLRISGGAWEVCNAADFQDCRILDGDVPDLRTYRMNDTISSLRPARTEQQAGGVRPSTGSTHYNRERSEFTAECLYEALLAREGDEKGLSQASQQIFEGRLDPLVRSLISSQEFRDRTTSVGAEEILGQMYRGLLGREMDTSGRDNFLRQIERREYADVVFDMMRSAEFRGRLP